MNKTSASISVVLCLCSMGSLHAQTLVGNLGGSFPFGCVTVLTPLSVPVPIQGQTPVITDSAGDVIPPVPLTLLPEVDVIQCGQGVSVDIGGVLKTQGGIHFADGTTLTSASQLTASPDSRVWSSFAIAFLAKYTISSFTPDNNIAVTRVQAQLPVSPSRCSTNAVVSLNNGTTTTSLTLSALANDSGPVNFNFSAGTPITLSVTTPADCLWGIPPAAANIVVQYKVTQ